MTDETQRAKLRERIRNKRNQRMGTVRPESVESKVMETCGGDAELLRVAQTLLKNPNAAKQMVRSMHGGPPPSPKDLESSDEEGLPPTREMSPKKK